MKPRSRLASTRSVGSATNAGSRTAGCAFPAISAGIYGWPVDDAARQAVAGLREASVEHITEVRFVLFSEPVLAAFEAALSD